MDSQQSSSHAEGLVAAQLAADAAGQDWQAYAYQCLIDFAERNKTFMIEDITAELGDDYRKSPGDERAWGAVARHALEEGVIFRISIGISRKHHGSYKTVWGSRLC